jgi:hypothetical protein
MIFVTRTGYSKNKPNIVQFFSIACPANSETLYDALSYLMVTDNLFYNIGVGQDGQDGRGISNTQMSSTSQPEVTFTANARDSCELSRAFKSFKWHEVYRHLGPFSISIVSH